MTEVPEDQVRDLERDADEMEEGLGELQGRIDTAQEQAAEQRERADPEATAGDFKDEADRSDDSGEGGQAIADAPVHEARQVEAGEEDEADRSEEGGDAIADAPVHEARQVEPGEEGEAERSEEDEEDEPDRSGEGDDAPDDDFVG